MSQSQPSATEPSNEVFEALAAEPRREILTLLGGGEASVSELAANFDISRPAVSKHLAVLRRAGLVDRRREGRQHFYRLDSEPFKELLDWLVALDEFWARELDALGDRLADDHEIPDELEAALKENETAWEIFQSFSNSDQHAFIASVEEAKTEETKKRRIERTVELAEQDLRAYDENNKRRL